MEKKVYKKANIEIITFEVEDIILTSGVADNDGKYLSSWSSTLGSKSTGVDTFHNSTTSRFGTVKDDLGL